MAIDLTLKSNAITNREATPSVANEPGQGGASKLRSVTGYLASVTAALSVGSIIRMVSVPSNAIVHRVVFQSAIQGDASDTGTVDIGVYRTNKDGGLVAFASSDSFFASAIDWATTAVARTDETNQSGTNTIAKQNQPLWKAIGMAKDPNAMLDICLTVSTADVVEGTGAAGLMVEYSD